MEIHRIPVLSNNYIFLCHHPKTGTATVVDPAEAQPVLAWLDRHSATLTAIFNTHHHHDHVGGNHQLLQRYPEAVVYAGAADRDRIPGQQVFLEEGDRVSFGDRVGEVLFVPGHTLAHIAYYFPPLQPDQPGDLFCGDTLFAGGCGRLKEGTPAQMLQSLSRLRTLPDQTRIWCAHEYTLENLTFALTVDRDNCQLQQRLEQVRAARQQQQATIPSLLGLEKQTNPFLRWDVPALQAIAGSTDAVRTFARLRGMKDLF